jgi:thioredoxin 1
VNFWAGTQYNTKIKNKDMVAFITELNEENYKSFTERGLVLVDVKAEWCGPCKVIGPIVDQISSEYYGKLTVGKLDADGARDLVQELGIRNIPTLLLYKDGEIVERNTGMITKEKIQDLVDNHLGAQI